MSNTKNMLKSVNKNHFNRDPKVENKCKEKYIIKILIGDTFQKFEAPKTLTSMIKMCSRGEGETNKFYYYDDSDIIAITNQKQWKIYLKYDINIIKTLYYEHPKCKTE